MTGIPLPSYEGDVSEKMIEDAKACNARMQVSITHNFMTPEPRKRRYGRVTDGVGPIDRMTIQFARDNDLDLAELKSKSRRQGISRLRQHLWLILHEEVGQGHSLIARYFDRDHTTISFGIRQARKRREADQ